MKHVKIALSAGLLVLAAGAAQAGSSFSGWDIQIGWGGNTWSVAANPMTYTMTEYQGDNGHTRYRVIGSHTTPNWAFSWDIEMDPDPFISSSFTVQNLTGITQDVTVTAILPIFPPLPGPGNIMSGSLSGTVGDGDGLMDPNGNGATMTTQANGRPYYEALIDGGDVRSLRTAPQFHAAPLGLTSDIDTVNFIGEGAPAAFFTIGIRNAFTLTSMDNGSMTSTFFLIPTPAGAAVFGLIGLAGLRRRR